MITFKNLNIDAIIQALKTGVAAVLAILVADFLRLPQNYWAAISAVVIMQSEVAATFTAARERLIGTAIGAFMAALFVQYLGHTLFWFALAVVVTMLICQFLGLDQSYRLACVTVAIIMLIYSGRTVWSPAPHRFLEVAVGNLTALGIAAIPLSRPFRVKLAS